MLTTHARVGLITLLGCLLTSCNSNDSSPPELKSLEVAGATGTMFPAFNTKIKHYGIRCNPSDMLQISASAASAQQALFVDRDTRARGSLDFEIMNPADGQDIVINVSRGTNTNSYILHCIPNDVPTIDILVSTPDASDGLLFLTPQFFEMGERKTYLLIMDNNGVPRFQRKIDGRAVDFKPHPDGRYTYAVGIGQNQFGIRDHLIIVLDDSFDEIDQLSTVGLTQTDNHDFIFTPEGSHIFISYDSTVRNMEAFGLSAEEVVGDSVIQEVDDNGNVLFEWNSWDHIDLNDCQESNFLRFPSDYAHLNSLGLTEDGDIIASFRGCGQVLRIDRPSGAVDWYLGGSKSDFQITGDPFNEFCGQHTALPLENGNVIMFDNGIYCLGDREAVFGQFSRAVEYALDPVAGQAMYVRDYSLNGTYQEFTRSQGSVQPLSNGNWLLGWGNGPEMSATEVNSSGETVFEVKLSVEGDIAISYRAFRSQTTEL